MGRSAQPRRALVVRYSAANLAHTRAMRSTPEWEGMTPLQTAMAEPPYAQPTHTLAAWLRPSCPPVIHVPACADALPFVPGRYDNHDGSPRPDIAALIVEEEAALAADPDAAKPDKHCQWYE